VLPEGGGFVRASSLRSRASAMVARITVTASATDP
jgi:hypothetical protein